MVSPFESDPAGLSGAGGKQGAGHIGNANGLLPGSSLKHMLLRIKGEINAGFAGEQPPRHSFEAEKAENGN